MLQYIDGLNLHISVDNLLLFKKKKKGPKRAPLQQTKT